MTSPTTPRDAIGLSDRLRDGSDNWLMSDSAREEIATQLDALHKELAQTQAHLAIRNGDLAEAVRERDSIQERVKELESDRDLYERLCSEEFTRATRIQQERDALSARVKELEAERDKWDRRVAYDELKAREYENRATQQRQIDNLTIRAEAAESRATSAEQERDEAYERAAKVAESAYGGKAHTYASENADVYRAQDEACAHIAAAIRRLAAGIEKEKRE